MYVAPGSGISYAIALVLGSMAAIPGGPDADAHTYPPPNDRPSDGLEANPGILATTSPVAGSMRSSSCWRLRTHSESKPSSSSTGPNPTSMVSTTSYVLGSIRTSALPVSQMTHTESRASTICLGSSGTSTDPRTSPVAMSTWTTSPTSSNPQTVFPSLATLNP